MALITWNNDYSVGVKTFDSQHKKVFSLINDLYEQIQKGEDKKNLKKNLDELLAYGNIHLKAEEDAFTKYDFPEKKGHAETHQLYRDKIADFVKRQDQSFLSYEIIDFLEDWWLHHITGVDKAYTEFFQKKGLE